MECEIILSTTYSSLIHPEPIKLLSIYKWYIMILPHALYFYMLTEWKCMKIQTSI